MKTTEAFILNQISTVVESGDSTTVSKAVSIHFDKDDADSAAFKENLGQLHKPEGERDRFEVEGPVRLVKKGCL